MANEKLFRREDVSLSSRLWYSQGTHFEHPEWTLTPKYASGDEGSPLSHPLAAVDRIPGNFVFPGGQKNKIK